MCSGGEMWKMRTLLSKKQEFCLRGPAYHILPGLQWPLICNFWINGLLCLINLTFWLSPNCDFEKIPLSLEWLFFHLSARNNLLNYNHTNTTFYFCYLHVANKIKTIHTLKPYKITSCGLDISEIMPTFASAFQCSYIGGLKCLRACHLWRS